MNNKKYIVFLDLDGTITTVNSGYALMRTAWLKKMISRKELLNAIAVSILHRLKLLPAEKIIVKMGKWLRGTRQEKLSDLAFQAAETHILNSVFDEVLDEIRMHRSNNADFALLSSAILEICKPVALHLGIDNIICTEMECPDGKFSGSPSGNYCFGKEKARRLKAFCHEKGFAEEEAYYYADSFSDISALGSVGNPVCINPGKRLRRKAEKNGWVTMKWNNYGRKK